ncbi:response regulator transcription factor [Dyadobacter aurulentus]|uniref:response regulator transcription factor n=1 Tax=Dyadobacter sp. UC 10 TaxID=2605428 RepID=UPI0011F35883|nr:response regulator transcription factor [Dyadobacter sp. UC 10]KAA0993384.1 response regulator transcription factor [Dyadobacter sp. UC 10]
MKVLIIESQPLMRGAIRQEIKDHLPKSKITHVTSIDEVMQAVRDQSFDLVILEICIKGASMQIIKDICASKLGIKILVYSSLSEAIYALPAVSSGAHGFLSKDSSIDQLRIAVDTVLGSKIYFSKAIQDALLSQVIANVNFSDHDPLKILTPRESLVMQLLLQGNKVREIAQKLDLQQSTVSTFKLKVFKKLKVDSMMALSAKMNMLR